MPALTWDHIEDIALNLYEAHPDVDPLLLQLADVQKRVTELPNFKDDPRGATEGTLDAIQMAWYEEYKNAH